MRTPVTIITGFLGAGKTSLLNHLIGQHPDTRFAIIENEFGDIGIDNDLVIMYGKNIYRIKGILHFQAEPQPVIFQSVRTQFAFDRLEAWPNDAVPNSRIVFIAHNVKRQVLEKGLNSLGASEKN